MMELLRVLARDQDESPQCPSEEDKCGAALVTARRVHHCVADQHESVEHSCSCGMNWAEVVEPAKDEE